jgi:hypothetical protein
MKAETQISAIGISTGETARPPATIFQLPLQRPDTFHYRIAFGNNKTKGEERWQRVQRAASTSLRTK